MSVAVLAPGGGAGTISTEPAAGSARAKAKGTRLGWPVAPVDVREARQPLAEGLSQARTDLDAG